MAGITYFKKTVPYTIVVRMSVADNAGVSLNAAQEWLGVKEEGLRDFKIANRKHFLDGMLVEIEEPDVDWVSPNTLTQADMDALLSNFAKLKVGLQQIDSLPVVGNILERAKELNKPSKTLDLIKARIDELSEFVMSPDDMQGVYDS